MDQPKLELEELVQTLSVTVLPSTARILVSGNVDMVLDLASPVFFVREILADLQNN